METCTADEKTKDLAFVFARDNMNAILAGKTSSRVKTVGAFLEAVCEGALSVLTCARVSVFPTVYLYQGHQNPVIRSSRVRGLGSSLRHFTSDVEDKDEHSDRKSLAYKILKILLERVRDVNSFVRVNV